MGHRPRGFWAAVATGVVATAFTLLILSALFAPVLPAPTRIEAIATFTALTALFAALVFALHRARSESAAAERRYVVACGAVVVMAMGFGLLAACANVYFAFGGTP